jgi:hypothetical protein
MRKEEEKKKQCNSNIKLIYSLQCHSIILEIKGEVVAPIVSKIEKHFNCNLVFILLLKGKVITFIFLLCRQLIVLPSLEKTTKVAEIFSLQI